MSPEMFRKLAGLGLSHDQMAGVLELLQEQKAEDASDLEQGREKARERWRRWKNKQGTNVGKRLQTDTNVGKQLARVEDSSSKEEISGKKVEKEETSPSARSTRGSRIPDDFKPDIAAAIADGLSPAAAALQASNFIDYWRSKPGKDGLKLDWPATWRLWYRRDLHKPQQRSTAPPAETVGSLSKRQLFEQRQNQDAPDDTTGRVVQIDARRLDESPGTPRSFAVSGNILGRI